MENKRRKYHIANRFSHNSRAEGLSGPGALAHAVGREVRDHKIELVSLLALALLVGGAYFRQAAPTATTSVPLYSKFEVSYPVNKSYSNPYDPSVVDVEAVFTRPDGSTFKIPGFYYQNYTRSGGPTGETLTPSGSPQWMVRYAPTMVGQYSYTVTLHDSSGTSQIGSGSFSGVASSNPGYVKTVGLHFEFSNGTQFIPLGINAPWFQGPGPTQGHWGWGTYGMDNLVNTFKANGLNMMHLWTCTSGFADPMIECDKSADTVPTQADQGASWQMDWLVNLSEQNGMYIFPILKHQDQQNFDPGDKIYIRYAISRWGYSPAIMGWDTFKEGATNTTTVSSYLQYLTSTDPYHKPTSASEFNHYAASNNGTFNTVMSNPNLTVVQDHDYSNECLQPYQEDTGLYAVNLMIQYNLRKYNKPSFFGETGVHPCASDGVSDVFSVRSSYYDNDTTGLIVGGEAWGELLSTSGAFSPWSYDITPNQLAPFKAIAAFVKALPGPIPDSATLFETYNSTSQATVSNKALTVMGRKNADFGMFRISNASGDWHSVLMDKKTPTPVSGATMTLLNMASGKNFTVKWFNTTTGAVVSSATVNTSGTSLTLSIPTVTNDIVAYVASGSTASNPPTVSLTANPSTINSGSSSTLSWSSTNATSCSASGGWSGSKATSGSQSVSPTATTSYTLTCTGSGGSANDSVSITVNQPTGTPGDINGDGVVNVFDLSILISDYSTSNAAADLNHDGIVNALDMSILLSNYGT